MEPIERWEDYRGSMKASDLSVSLANGGLITSLAAHLADGLLTISQSGRISYVNDSATRITGYAKDEMMGQAVEELFPPIVEKDGKFHPITRALRTKETVVYQSKPRWKDIDLIVIPTDCPVEANGLDLHVMIVLRNMTATSELEEGDPHTARMRLMGQ